MDYRKFHKNHIFGPLKNKGFLFSFCIQALVMDCEHVEQEFSSFLAQKYEI